MTTVLLPDDNPAFTGIDNVGIAVHITSTNVYAPSVEVVRPSPGRNLVVAATTSGRPLAAFGKTLFPTATRSSSEQFERLASSIKDHQLVVEFETGDIPVQPWRYQLHSKAVTGSHAHVTAVLPIPEARLAVLTFDGTLRKNVGYRLLVLMEDASQDSHIESPTLVTTDEFSVTQSRQSTGVLGGVGASASVAQRLVVNRVPTSTRTARALRSDSWPVVVRAGSERFYSYSTDTRESRKGLIYNRPFIANSEDRVFDDVFTPPAQYGARQKTTGRDVNMGSRLAREDLTLKYTDVYGNTRYRIVAGSRQEAASELLSRQSSDPNAVARLVDINTPNRPGSFADTTPEIPTPPIVLVEGPGPSKASIDQNGYSSSLSYVAGVEVVVEHAPDRDVCGGDSLNKLLPAILRGFGDNLATFRGEPVTRTLDAISSTVQVKVPKGFLLGKIRVETTLAFPKDLALGPYKVWIDGNECEYAEATSGCNAYLVDVVSKNYVRKSILANAEVILDVPSLTPELIGLG